MTDTPRKAQSTTLADVEVKPVMWLWQGHIPRGKVTVLDGDPDNGKSLITLDLAARVSMGDVMPDQTPGIGPSDVLLLSAEDDAADVIAPRLLAAGADMRRIHLVTVSVPDGNGNPIPTQMSFPRDLPLLEELVLETRAALVVIDPLMAFLPGRINSHKDQDMRAQVMAPLKDLAERTNAAIVLVRHLNKNGDMPTLYRGGGSIGIIGAARSGIMVYPDPDDPQPNGRHLLVVSKHNLSPAVAALAYTIETATVSCRAGLRTDLHAPKIAWQGTVDTPIAPPVALSRQQQQVVDALRTSHQPLPVIEIAQYAGIPYHSIRTVLCDMAKAGAVVRKARGTYALPGMRDVAA